MQWEIVANRETIVRLTEHSLNPNELLGNECSIAQELEEMYDRVLTCIGHLVRVELATSSGSLAPAVQGILCNIDPEVLQLVIVPMDHDGNLDSGSVSVVMMHAVRAICKSSVSKRIKFSHQEPLSSCEDAEEDAATACDGVVDLCELSEVCSMEENAARKQLLSKSDAKPATFTKAEVLELLSRQGIPYREAQSEHERKDGDTTRAPIFVMNGLLVIQFPYDADACSSGNEILLQRMRNLLRRNL